MASNPSRRPAKQSKVVTVKEGHLPVTEFLSDRPGANSPFGDDQTFPLPPSALVYRHPTAS